MNVRTIAGRSFRIHKETFVWAMAAAIIMATPGWADTPPAYEQTDVFCGGHHGYEEFRGPVLVVTKGGPLLAIVHGGVTRSDFGNRDVLQSRSLDGGRTWMQFQVIRDEGKKRCGGTTALVDRQNGRVHLLVEVAGSRIYHYTSNDDGKTWAEHQEITSIFKAFRPRFHWTRLSTGSGHGIVLKRGNHSGRFIFPFWCTKEEQIFRSGLIYSDDRGETWNAGGLSDPSVQSNETTIYEGVDGTLHINMRAGGVKRQEDRQPHRVIATSKDGGQTWSASQYDDQLISPQCHASTLRYTWPEEGRSRVLFSNPSDSEQRVRMTVRLSYDDGETWPRKRMIFGGPAAYSDLTRLEDGRIGLLWEGGDEDKYARLMFAAFKLSWLTKGEEEL